MIPVDAAFPGIYNWLPEKVCQTPLASLEDRVDVLNTDFTLAPLSRLSAATHSAPPTDVGHQVLPSPRFPLPGSFFIHRSNHFSFGGFPGSRATVECCWSDTRIAKEEAIDTDLGKTWLTSDLVGIGVVFMSSLFPRLFTSSASAPVVTTTISVGDNLPDANLSYFGSDGELQTVTISDLTKSKKAIFFTVPRPLRRRARKSTSLDLWKRMGSCMPKAWTPLPASRSTTLP
ncbi:hypothetical protein ZIOFF_070085 [Zingiber officinale]|uniref:Uncharacterized protein n=1 Tax=Zingiber officinale TaxID=94328 RepID=A0A8J5EUD5_ZINOF|nr:hypothetical protein ZIOFF_070085 [Zingiber officinale]